MFFMILPFPGSGPARPAPSQQEASLSPRRPKPGNKQQISQGGDTAALRGTAGQHGLTRGQIKPEARSERLQSIILPGPECSGDSPGPHSEPGPHVAAPHLLVPSTSTSFPS